MVPKIKEDGTKENIKKPSLVKRIICSASREARIREQDKDSGKQLIFDKKIGFRYLEAIRSITSRIEKDMQSNEYKVLLVTSTLPKEGKSTFAINLALTLSKFGKRVMLIDGDLRNPSLRELSGAKGASYNMEEFLSKKVSLKDALINIADTRVVLIAADKPTPNPIEHINSKQMHVIIEQCKSVADYVIIDAPACAGVADAVALSKYTDAAIYVVREDYAKVDTILDVLQELSYTKKPILGSVLNDSIGQLGLNYGYGRGYGYGYGRGYGYGYGYGYGGYGYGYGYGKGYGYGYGESAYEKVNDSEFMTGEKKTAKKIVISNESIDGKKDR
jgi:capsular exopolysaccharide synthesis family protein